jgi:hypothetical protein
MVMWLPVIPITNSIMATTQIQNFVKKLLTKLPSRFMAWLVCLALSVPEEPATPLHSNAEGFV